MTSSSNPCADCSFYAESDTHAGHISTSDGIVRHINLHGNDFEMAQSLGSRMTHAIIQGPVSALSKRLELAPHQSRYRRWANTLRFGTHLLLGRKIIASGTKHTSAAIDALAHASKLPQHTFLDATLMHPQRAAFIAFTRDHARKKKHDMATHTLIAQSAKHTLHAHIIRAPVPNSWAHSKTLTFYHPNQKLSFACLTSAGLWNTETTGMNSAGITLSIEPRMRLRDLERGVPIGILTKHILGSAHDLPQAIELARKTPTLVECTITLTHHTGRIHRRATIECNAHKIACVSFSNISPGAYPDVMAIAADLGHKDDIQRASAVIFEPAHARIWIGTSNTDPARGWFVPFILHASIPGTPDRSIKPFEAQPGWHDTPHAQSLELYQKAASAHAQGTPRTQTFVRMEHALSLFEEDAHMHTALALLAISIGSYTRAQGALEHALRLEKDPKRRDELTLYMAWTLDLRRLRRAALAIYNALIKNGDSTHTRVKASATRCHRIAFTPRQARAISIDLFAARAILP